MRRGETPRAGTGRRAAWASDRRSVSRPIRVKKRSIWFAFRVPRGELRPKSFSLQKTRDAGAFAFVAAVLGDRGYEPGPTLFNFPGSQEDCRTGSAEVISS